MSHKRHSVINLHNVFVCWLCWFYSQNEKQMFHRLIVTALYLLQLTRLKFRKRAPAVLKQLLILPSIMTLGLPQVEN